MNWLHYLVEANIYLGVFYLCYCLFLNNETHYTLSRIYLLFSCVISFVLPVTQLSILKPVEPIALEPVAITPTNVAIHYAVPPPPPPIDPGFTLQDGLIYLYILGVAIALTVFLFRLYQLFKLSRDNQKLNDNSYQIIHLKSDNTAFSFFNYLFIGTNISQSETIIAHELVHIRQKHSWDIMLLEILKVINWFNPFIYLLQRSIKTVHEYIADEQTAAYERDALTYSTFLLNNAYGIQGSAIAHSFFNYNLLKKRIIMLNKNRSGKLARLKYLAALPLCAGMLCASTLAFAKDYGWVDLTPKKTLAEKPKVKRLKIVDGNITAYSDNVTVKEKDGSSKKFVVGNITPADISYLLKEHKLKVTIVEADSATNRNNPMVVLPDAQDTIKHQSPPPPPINPIYKDLIEYTMKHVRYPAAARNKELVGNVLVSLRISDAHKITDLKVVNGIGSGCDEEVIRALKSYPGIISQKPGAYRLMTTFALIEESNSKSHYPRRISSDIGNSKNFIGQVVVVGYVPKLGIVKFPPPPPPVPPVKKVDKIKFPPPAPPVPPVKKVGKIKFPPPAESPVKAVSVN